MFGMKAIDNKQLLQVLATLDFPIANKLLEQVKSAEEDAEEIMQVLEILKTMEPQEMLAFLQLPIEQQIEMLAQTKEGEPDDMSTA
jgi:uncharacterized membrane-anchored protein